MGFGSMNKFGSGHFGPAKNNESKNSGGIGSTRIGSSSNDNSTKKGILNNCFDDHQSNGIPMLSRNDIRDNEKSSSIKRTRTVTFSNVEWKKFDNISVHPQSNTYHNEPPVHVKASNDSIDFYGYNKSAMDEGVYYLIGNNDSFEIECDVDTSQVLEHPQGYFYITFGIVSAHIDHIKGSFYINNNKIADVERLFKMKLCLINPGKYEVYINDVKKGEGVSTSTSSTRIEFGFLHDSHDCEKISRAFLKRIKMKQSRSSDNYGFGPSTSRHSTGFSF